jgi:uncharacterized lipoprotein YajG
MKQKISLLALVIISVLLFTSCNKDSQNAELKSSALSLKMQALNQTVSLPVVDNGLKSATISTAKVVWDKATMLVSKINFEAEMNTKHTGKDSISIEYSWKGPKTIDLFDLTTTIGSIILPAGTYDKISLKVNSEKEDANGLPLVFLSGNYTNTAGTVVPITVSVSDQVSFKTSIKDDAILAGVATNLSSTIQIYLDQLLLHVDISALDNATLTGGKLVISATSNGAIYQMIMQNLRKDHGHHFEHHGMGDD